MKSTIVFLVEVSLLLFIGLVPVRLDTQDTACFDLETVSNLNLEDSKWLLSHYDSLMKEMTVEQHTFTLKHLANNFSKFGNRSEAAIAYNKMGVIQRNYSLFKSALESHQLALNILSDDNHILIRTHNNIGVVYRRLDKPRLALRHHMLVMEMIDNLRDDEADSFRGSMTYYNNSGDLDFGRRVALNSIGNINLTLKQPKQALAYFEKALKMEKSHDNHLGMAINYNNMGYAYQELGDDHRALNFFEKSLAENNIIDSDVGRGICYNCIGDVYLDREVYSLAKIYFDSAYYYLRKTGDLYHSTQTHANLGRVFLKLDNYDSAFQHLKVYHSQSVFTNSNSLNADANALLSEYYQDIQQYDSALYYYKEAVRYNDSIVNKNNTDYLNELQTIYETNEKEQKISLMLAEDQIQDQKMLLLIIGSVVLILIIVSGILQILRTKRINLHQQEVLNQRLLRSQMNPHFLFNALGSIQSFMYKNEAKKASGFLNNFASLTRSVLENSTKDYISLTEEINTLRHYITLEQMRLRNAFDFEINLADGIESDFIDIPPMLIQPFVENAVKHGLSNLDYPGILLIFFREQDDMLHIEVSDNGAGINHHQKVKDKHHQSRAMEIFVTRKKLLEKTLKRKILLNVVDRSDQGNNETGTVVHISVPIIQHYD